jgi:hypothetical protein
MYRYNFWHDKNFIGTMILGADSTAKEVSNGCGANYFDNELTNQAFRKCSVCGLWYEEKHLTNGMCCGCGYLERLEEFINHCENELDKNWEDREELYKEDFTITYRGKTLILPFGAIEYNNITDCLKEILKENQE